MVLGVQFMATPLIIGLIQISFSLDEKETNPPTGRQEIKSNQRLYTMPLPPPTMI